MLSDLDHRFPADTLLRDAHAEMGSGLPVAPRTRSLLRFITCGSVDDGKSTLIGRLLYDSAVLPEDQLAVLRKESARSTHASGEIDYSLLLDGLAAEREQGITIDVAYRYFSTGRRAFIVADTPGHVQYTRNMATGASTADLAVLLVDARKGVLEQTRRHLRIVAMLGVRHVVLAVNKMDLVGYSLQRFREIESAFTELARDGGFASLISVPISAKHGENVRMRSAAMPWYSGPVLLEVLESVETSSSAAGLSARMPVQWVARAPDFRGFAGTLASGRLRPGDAVRVLPSGSAARVARIVSYDGDLAEATEGQAPTVVLDREVDVSRGDVIAADDGTTLSGRRWQTDLLWLSSAPYDPGRPLLLKLGTRTVPVRLSSEGMTVLDINTGVCRAAEALVANDIASLSFTTDLAIVAERYADSRALGGLILIDRETSETVALGLIRDRLPDPEAKAASNGSTAMSWIARPVDKHWRSLAKAISWRATGSLDTFVLAFLFTGHAKVAAAISLTEVATKIVLYFVHERVWQRIPIGREDMAPEAAFNGSPKDGR